MFLWLTLYSADISPFLATFFDILLCIKQIYVTSSFLALLFRACGRGCNSQIKPPPPSQSRTPASSQPLSPVVQKTRLNNPSCQILVSARLVQCLCSVFSSLLFRLISSPAPVCLGLPCCYTSNSLPLDFFLSFLSFTTVYVQLCTKTS